MNLNKRLILIIFIVVILISLIGTQFLPEEQRTKIQDFSTLVTLFSTLITLALALVLYNQIGLDQLILQKQAEVVIRLIEVLQVTHFRLRINNDSSIVISLNSISRLKDGYKEFGKLKILFHHNYLSYTEPITNFSTHTFLPKEILEKILDLTPIVWSRKDDVQGVGLCFLEVEPLHKSVQAQPQNNHLTDDYGSITLSQRDVTVDEFIVMWNSLIKECVTWLNSHSSYQELNIPFFRENKGLK